jgi:hypothetical protein
MAIRTEPIEELLAGKDPQEVFSQDGLLDELKKALAERILNAEMDQHGAAAGIESPLYDIAAIAKSVAGFMNAVTNFNVLASS